MQWSKTKDVQFFLNNSCLYVANCYCFCWAIRSNHIAKQFSMSISFVFDHDKCAWVRSIVDPIFWTLLYSRSSRLSHMTTYFFLYSYAFPRSREERVSIRRNYSHCKIRIIQLQQRNRKTYWVSDEQTVQKR